MLRRLRYGTALAGAALITAGLLSLAGPASAHPQGTAVCFTPIGTPGPSLRSVMFVAPQPLTGAFVVPLTVPLPSVPGVSLLSPTLLIPAAPAGGNPSLAIAQALTLLLGASAHPNGPSLPAVSCF